MSCGLNTRRCYFPWDPARFVSGEAVDGSFDVA